MPSRLAGTQEVQNIRGEIDGQLKAVSSSLNVAVSAASDKLRGDTREEKTKVEDAASTAASALANKINKGSSTVAKGMYALIDEAKKLGQEIDDNQNQLEDMTTKLTDGAEALSRVQPTCATQMLEIPNVTRPHQPGQTSLKICSGRQRSGIFLWPS